MSPGANFFVVSCAILIFSIINLSIGPIINKVITTDSEDGVFWGQLNCAKKSDDYEDKKKSNPSMSEEKKKKEEIKIRKCRNRKAMYNMEYTSFIFNIFIGFVCVLLGLYGLQKEIIPKTGFIGMGCGIVGFILTFVYVIYNGVVYTNYYNTEIYKVDVDGAFAEYDEDKNAYECFYYKKNDTDSIYAKYCDLIKSQYNYNYDLTNSFNLDPEKKACSDKYPSICRKNEYIEGRIPYGDSAYCRKLYYKNTFNNYTNYDLSARFLTVLLLSIIILLCYCGLVFSGFMLSKEQS